MRWSAWWLGASGLLLALYATYATWGALEKRIGTPRPIRLSEVGEFWLFFLAIVAFTVHVVLAERRRLRERGDAGAGRETEA